MTFYLYNKLAFTRLPDLTSPTPYGVPVNIKSPLFNVIILLIYSII